MFMLTVNYVDKSTTELATRFWVIVNRAFSKYSKGVRPEVSRKRCKKKPLQTVCWAKVIAMQTAHKTHLPGTQSKTSSEFIRSTMLKYFPCITWLSSP